mmetsp:Transcript_39171/g.61999  ORF Transcript_39171/g.61999 Transcript_39171/m.61999 type:complete len:122 (+) Transcript_39171:621-986(+)
MKYSPNLASKSLRWLGLHCKDVDQKIYEKAKIPFSPADTRKASSSRLLPWETALFGKLMCFFFSASMLSYAGLNPEIRFQLEHLIQTQAKYEIEALSAFSPGALVEKFLPNKLLAGDWICL